MAVTGLATGLSLWLPMRLLDKFVFDTTRTLPLIGLTLTTSLTGLAVYLFLSYLFRVEELSSFVSLFRRITHWKSLFVNQPEEPLILPAPDQN